MSYELKPGFTYHHRTLASGCDVRVVKMTQHKRHGACVQVEIVGKQRQGIARHRPRVWTLATWERLYATR